MYPHASSLNSSFDSLTSIHEVPLPTPPGPSFGAYLIRDDEGPTPSLWVLYDQLARYDNVLNSVDAPDVELYGFTRLTLHMAQDVDSGTLFVSDSGNYRVLIIPDARSFPKGFKSNSTQASYVIGQHNLTYVSKNPDFISYAIAYDPLGEALYVMAGTPNDYGFTTLWRNGPNLPVFTASTSDGNRLKTNFSSWIQQLNFEYLQCFYYYF